MNGLGSDRNIENNLANFPQRLSSPRAGPKGLRAEIARAVMPRAKIGSLTKIGVVWQKSDFWTKNRNFGPKKREPLLYFNHVLATTGKSCSKKKSAFAQIIKGGNVILGDFLG